MLRDKKKQIIGEMCQKKTAGEIQAPLWCWDLQIKETNNVMPSYKAQSLFDEPLWALKKSSLVDWTSVEKPAVKLNYILDKYIYRVIIIWDTLWNKTLRTESPW